MLTVAMSLTKVQGRFILQLDKKVTAINAVPIVAATSRFRSLKCAEAPAVPPCRTHIAQLGVRLAMWRGIDPAFVGLLCRAMAQQFCEGQLSTKGNKAPELTVSQARKFCRTGFLALILCFWNTSQGQSVAAERCRKLKP